MKFKSIRQITQHQTSVTLHQQYTGKTLSTVKNEVTPGLDHPQLSDKLNHISRRDYN